MRLDELEIQHERANAELAAFASEQESIDWEREFRFQEFGRAAGGSLVAPLAQFHQKLLDLARVGSRVDRLATKKEFITLMGLFIDVRKTLSQFGTEPSEMQRRLDYLDRLGSDVASWLDSVALYQPYVDILKLDTSQIAEEIYQLQRTLGTASANYTNTWEKFEKLAGKFGLWGIGSKNELSRQAFLHVCITILCLGGSLWLLFDTWTLFKTANVSNLNQFESEFVAVYVHLAPKIFLILICIVLLRISFASWHNYLLVRQKQLVLERYDVLATAMSTTEAKDQLLLAVFSTLSAHQPTGFSKANVESTIVPQQFQGPFRSLDGS